MRVGDGDPQVGLVERRVVVAAVPQDHVRLLLGLGEDRAVVDARVDDRTVADVGLVLLHLLDRAVVLRHVLQRREPLHDLLAQVAVGHGMPDGDGALIPLPQERHDPARRLALTAPGPNRTHGDHRLRARDHRGVDVERGEHRAGSLDDRAALVEIVEVDVGVGEDDLVDSVLADQVCELLLGEDGNPVRIAGSGELGRIPAVVDVRDLGGGEGHDTGVGSAAVAGIEDVEVFSGGSHDQDVLRHALGSWMALAGASWGNNNEKPAVGGRGLVWDTGATHNGAHGTASANATGVRDLRQRRRSGRAGPAARAPRVSRCGAPRAGSWRLRVHSPPR